MSNFNFQDFENEIFAGKPQSAVELKIGKYLEEQQQEEERPRKTRNKRNAEEYDDGEENEGGEYENDYNGINSLENKNQHSGSLWLLKKKTKKAVVSVELKPIQQISVEEMVESVLCISTKLFGGCLIETEKSKTIKSDETSVAPATELSSKCPWVIVSGGSSGMLNLWNPLTRQKIAVRRRR